MPRQWRHTTDFWARVLTDNARRRHRRIINNLPGKSLKTQMREYHAFHAPGKEEARRKRAEDMERFRKLRRSERRMKERAGV